MSQNSPTSPEEKTQRVTTLRSELRWPQLVASVAAAVAASAAASYLGVIGTIAGAAIISLVITVGSALLRHSLESTDDVVRNVVAKKRVLTSRAEYKEQSTQLETETEITASTTADALDVPDLKQSTPWWKKTRIRVAVTAVAVFLLSIGVVTGIEVATGKPLSELFGSGDDGGTSLSRIAAQLDSAGGGAPRNPPQETPTSTPTEVKSPVQEHNTSSSETPPSLSTQPNGPGETPEPSTDPSESPTPEEPTPSETTPPPSQTPTNSQPALEEE